MDTAMPFGLSVTVHLASPSVQDTVMFVPLPQVIAIYVSRDAIAPAFNTLKEDVES